MGDPFGGQSVFEATRGIHTYDFCDTGKDDQELYRNLYFCSYQNETMPYAILPWYIVDVETTGVRKACPETKEGCLAGLGLESCLEFCGNSGGRGEPCSDEILCGTGMFCKRSIARKEDDGICSVCPSIPEDCLADSVGSVSSKKSCLECDLKCAYRYWGDFTVDGQVIWAYGLDSSPLRSIPGSAFAPLVDCSDLVLDKVDICPGAKDSICLVHDYVRDSFYWKLAWKCENSGGLAMVLYFSDTDYHSDDVPGEAILVSPANIPVIRIAYNSGVALKENKLGSFANVTTYDAGEDCWIDQYCSTTVSCMDDGKYCWFNEDMDEGLWCYDCPENPLECFFPAAGSPIVQNEVEACASKCAATVEFGMSCKMCGETLTSFDFGVDDPSDRCDFCAEEDVKHPDRVLPLFSVGDAEVKCWQAQSFFSRVDVHKDSKNCKLAQLQNYICGCEGSGYAGANTQAKRNALVWVPRVTAILSGLGSLFVLIDVLKETTRRSGLFHQLMAQMSFFDIIGSAAYAFTSLPIPSNYYFQGGSGNEATCTAQGFFMQVGTVACFTNVSLAFYYFFIIQKGWSETRLKKIRIWFFICPIVVGMTFAFAGIPFYGNMLLWCNNAAPWWPDIPVAIAILAATLVMGSVCWDVHKKHQASKRWCQGDCGTGNSLATKVFWQSFWYLIAFYMTWPPYLALQYFWASGKEYGNYSFILYAGTVVPLQGVWNFFVYARNRQLKSVRQRASSLISSGNIVSIIRSRKSSNTQDRSTATTRKSPSATISNTQDHP